MLGALLRVGEELRAADDLDPVEDEVVHVGRRVERAERPVQVGWIEVEGNVDPARQQDLKAIAGANVLLDLLHVRHEIPALVARVSLVRDGTKVG
jgi:hypothetical protein